MGKENAQRKIFPKHGRGSLQWIYYDDYVDNDPNEEWREIECNSKKFRVSSPS